MYDTRDHASGATQSGQRDAPRVAFGLAQPVWPRAYAVALTTLLACGIALAAEFTTHASSIHSESTVLEQRSAMPHASSVVRATA